MRNGLARRARVRSLLFLFPSLLGTLIFFVIPFGMIIYYALVSKPVGGEFAGFSNFIRLFHNRAFLVGLRNTAILCASAVTLSVVLALGLAVLLENALPARGVLRTAFLCPMFVPAASVVLVWTVLFHNNGAINAALGAIGISPVDWFHTWWGRPMVLLMYLWRNLGLYVLLFTSALASVPEELIGMADLDGAGPVRRFFTVKLPYLAPTMVFVVMLSLIYSMKIFREVYLLTGAYPYDYLYLLQHFMNNTFMSMDYPKLCAAALVLLTVMGVITAAVFRLEDRVGRDLENG